MSYQVWSVVFGEIPSATKWNILGGNDAAFNDGTGIANGVIGNSQLASGVIVQVVGNETSAVSTGTTVIPLDDTIPQNTEGIQCLSQAITPKSVTNILVIEAVVMMASSVANNHIAALFQDSGANAIAAAAVNNQTANSARMVPLRKIITAGTVSSTTFTVRGGGNAAGTTTFNGSAAARLFGAIAKSSIKITEYKA